MHIWVPKTKIIEPRDPIAGVMRVGGIWKLAAMRPGRYIRPLTGWFPNLITDGGLDRMGDKTDYLDVCAVGSGNTPPQDSDSQLETLVASTSSTWQANANTISTEAPWFGAKIRYFQFSAAGSSQNLSEIGVGWATTGLFSRALILDDEGAPTTISLQEGEILRATYELRLFAPTVDVQDSIMVDVDGSPVSTDIVLRAGLVGNLSAWSLRTGGNKPPPAGISGGQAAPAKPRIYNGSLGTIEGQPSGNLVDIGFSQIANDEYTPGNLYRDGTISFSTSEGNISGGEITALQFTCGSGSSSLSGFGCFQVSFDPPIPKNDQRTAAIRLRHSWARNT